jgi:hypothetical protein
MDDKDTVLLTDALATGYFGAQLGDIAAGAVVAVLSSASFDRHGIDSRIGKGRADVVHQTLDPLIVAGTWLAAGGVVYGAVKSLKRLGKSRNR